MLTTYTKLNKSASIFLGSNSKSTYEHRPAANVGAAVNASHSDPSLLRRKESMENLAYNQPSGKTVPHSENVLKGKTFFFILDCIQYFLFILCVSYFIRR